MSKLPFVTSDIPRDLRAFVDRVREAFNGKGRDKLITLGDLVDGGVTDNDGDVIPILPGGDYATPPAPTGVTAVGGLANILVSWDNPTYYGHSYAEVWGASTNNLGAAVLLGMAPGSTFSDAIGSGATRYYWVRFVNVVDVVGPYNATAGTVGQTAYDPAYLLQVLNNSITTSELSTALNTTISTNTTQITNIRNLYMVKMDNNGFLSGYGLMSTLSEGGVATSDFFINANRFAVTAPMGSMPLWSSGTSYVRNAAVRISGNNSKLLICQIAGTSGGSTPSIAGDIGTTVTDGSVTWQIASSVPLAVLTTSAILNGQTLAPGVYMDGAYIVNATIGGAKIRQAEIDIANITGSLTANRITAGSISTGEYIQSTSYIAGTQGWRINGNGSADFQNVTVRGTIYASAGTIGSANIGSNYVQSTNYVAGSTGWRLSSNGDFEASNGTFRGSITGASGTFSGSLSSTSGTIGGITISAGGLQSSNYVNGSSGWAIAPNGQAQFNQVVIRGSLQSTVIYTGSVYKDLGSDLQLLSAAAMGTVQDLVSDTTTPYTNTSLRLYGPNYHASAPLNQRCRNTNTTPLAITITATATVDHFFSLWYRYNGGSWVYLTKIVEPQGGDGSASITYTTAALGLASSEYLDFGFSASNESGVFQDPGKKYLKYLTVGISAVNL